MTIEEKTEKIATAIMFPYVIPSFPYGKTGFGSLRKNDILEWASIKP